MANNKDVIAIYTRKSKFTGKGDSIENQAELCREYIAVNYGAKCAETAVVFEDEGYSGKNLNRPKFKDMMEAIHAREYKAIVVYRLDRISRSIGDFANLIQELDRLNVEFVSIRERFDTNSPMGRAMMYIASVFSQLERETTAERIRDNMHELSKTGRWLGGTTPTGYQSEPIVVGKTDDGKERKAFKLTVIPDEARIVKLIFNLFVELGSLTKVETELLKRGIQTKRGKEFTRFAIKGILTNPVYLIADEAAYQYFSEHKAEVYSDKSAFDGKHGVSAYNRTEQGKGKTTVYNPINEWIVSVGKHHGLISSETWLKAQELIEKNKDKSYGSEGDNEALLTGVLYCKCGSRMYHKPSKALTTQGKRKYSYMCLRKAHSKGALCSNSNPPGNVLDSAIIEQLKQLNEDKSEFLRQLNKCKEMLADDYNQYEEALATARKDLAEHGKTIDALIDSLSEVSGKEAIARVSSRIEELGLLIESDKQHVVELEGMAKGNILSNAEFDALKRMLSVFADTIDSMSIDQKRRMIKTLVKKVVWDGKNVHLYLFGAEGDAELPDIPTPPENDADGDLPGKQRPPIDEKFQWGEDSKRSADVRSGEEENAERGLALGLHRHGSGRQQPLSDGRGGRGRHDVRRLAGQGGLRPRPRAGGRGADAAGAGDRVPALRPRRADAPHPAGDRGKAGHQPQLCIAARLFEKPQYLRRNNCRIMSKKQN